jgi:hypothetical protein
MSGPYDFSNVAIAQQLTSQCKHQAAQNVYYEPNPPRGMTAADLGIIDELLDEKIGAEMMAEVVWFGVPTEARLTPLDGTRLWDNS